MADFKELQVWVKAKELAIYIYQVTSEGNITKDFGFRDQMRRAAVSISSNIAEGEQLGTNQQSVRHLYIARGSSAELLSQSIIAYEIQYFTEENLHSIETECNEINMMLTKLIKART